MSALFSLQGKAAVVTGGASGIGLATVKRFIAAGAQVMMADLQDQSALATEVGAEFFQCNVSQEDQVKALLQHSKNTFGRLDIIVNNAGVFSDYKSLAESDNSDFEFCMGVNLMGAFYAIKHAQELMNEGGAIVNTASAAAVHGAVKIGSYVASKHALAGLSKTAALELSEKRIRVNCVCPTTVNTPMAHEEGGEFMIEAECTANPMQRICEPEEVAALIHFLAADDCGFVNAQSILIDGGASAGTSEKAFEKLSAV